MKEYLEINKESKKAFKKYKKGIRRLIIGLILLGAGLVAIPGSLIADALMTLPFIKSDLAILIAVLVKSGLMVGGAFGAILGLANSSKADNEIRYLNDTQRELVENIQYELDSIKEKNKELEEGKTASRRTAKSISTRIKKEMSEMSEDLEYPEEAKHKVKK